MIFYLFLSILILSAISIHLRIVLGLKTTFDKMMLFFLLTVATHLVLVFAVRTTPAEFNYIAVPCGLLYGPILYFGFLGLNDIRIKKSQYILHVSPFLVLFALYAILLAADEWRLAFCYYFYAILYGTLILSWLGYPLWIILQKPKEQESYEQNGLLLSVAFILISQSIYLLLLVRFVIDFKGKLENSSPIFYVFTCLLASVTFVYIFLVNQLRERQKIFNDKKTVAPAAHIPYQKSKIETRTAGRYRELLDEYMQGKPYLKPRFSLEEVAGELKIYKHHCSQIFNTEYGMNFSQYINSKRVEHACSFLEQKEMNLSMEEIAESCGFNSKASFYRNFTNIKGCTPMQHRRAFLA